MGVVVSASQGPMNVLNLAMFEKLRDNFPIFSDVFGWGRPAPPDVTAGERTAPLASHSSPATTSRRWAFAPHWVD